MPKKPFQDIVPSGRSIRNIPLPESRVRPVARPLREIPLVKPARPVAKPLIRTKAAPVIEQTPHISHMELEEPAEAPEADVETLREVRQQFEEGTERHVRKSQRSYKGLIWAGSVVAVLALAVLVSNVFHAATITVTPRTATASIDDSISASTAGAALAFVPLTITETGSAEVTATGEQKVDKAATGVIVIYNNYNATVQRLVKNTRFETPEGLVFRITDSVTVPGKKGTVPGSVEANVIADATGDKYNVGLKDFTIPGFKGDPRYATFYARSKTSLAGGFTGTVKVVPDADRLKAQNQIKADATASLLAKVGAQKAANQVFFGSAYSVDCAPVQDEAESDTKVLVKMDCSLTAALFDAQVLSAYLATKHVASYDKLPILVNNLSSLSFAPKSPFAPGASSTIAFTLKGSASFEWLYDEAGLKTALAGKAKTEVPAALQQFPTIDKANISIRPVWRSSIPASVKDITVKKAL